MRKSITIVLLCAGYFALNAQTLYTPRNIARTFQKGTRDISGKPGKNYWQNRARYAISVTANPPNRNITGTEEITYTNNSPDTLKSLVFKLILNVHQPGAVRQSPASPEYLTSGIHIDSYSENGKSKKWTVNGPVTADRVGLMKPLAPHDSVKLSIGWHYDVSVESGREGAIDSTTFFLAYFYPRVAVYDDSNGWDRTAFTDAQEFYNDFNDYTFQVTVPKNYIVWATGDLLNTTEVLQATYAKRLNDSFTSDEIIPIATAKEVLAKGVTTQKDFNTWKWKANNVPDVTVAISNRYAWDAGSVIVDQSTKRRASVQSAYDDAAQDFHQMVSFGKHALDWFSSKWPGVPYPYQKNTIVQGYADMEYPMMVNDSHQQDPNFARFVAEHEIAHTWFPFYMGINENRYGFMDEGWATTLEYLIGTADVGKERADQLFKGFRVSNWTNDPSAEQDIPIITPGNILSGVALGNNQYGKAALGYLAMKDLLGDDMFKKCLHEFMNRWNGKHPLPWDMFNTFNNVSGKDLNWFWSNWYFSNDYIDLSIQSVTSSSKEITITISNIGGYPAPVNVLLTYDDGSKEILHQTPGIWMTNPKQSVVKVSTKKKVQSVILDGEIFMDANKKNNEWKAK
ncbi:MAG: M1 family metallopeptidase [Cyclobacteriaceae bacterium]|nr:M1 family metallopeptidase [Cyclobacteriaceae bacterium]